MHALGVLLFNQASFKNCVTTGTLLAADGAKISKSKMNYTDPKVNIDLYGADAMRYYMLGSVVMTAEDAAFKDEELREAHNRYINMIWNSYTFYDMHTDENIDLQNSKEATHVLDRWILARLHETVAVVTEHMDSYDTIRSARTLREFVTDLSTWYIRRNRDRFKSEDESERQMVLAVSQEVFMTLAKLTAPITPFIAESLYQGLGGEKGSVHLEEWPENVGEVDMKVIEDMAEVRRIASLALEARQREGIKVRQPLAKITLSDTSLEGKEELQETLLDEINVKELVFDTKQEEAVLLDTQLTVELKREGAVRDLVRAVQELRKQNKLQPEDRITLHVQTDEQGEKVLSEAKGDLEKIAGVALISKDGQQNTTEVTINDSVFTLAIVVR